MDKIQFSEQATFFSKQTELLKNRFELRLMFIHR